MGKFILIFLLSLAVFTAQAQRTASDTIKGAETIEFTGLTGAKTAILKFTQLGGTSDGTGYLYGSLDNVNWVKVLGNKLTTAQYSSVGDATFLFPKDTVKVTSGGTWSFVDKLGLYPFYKITIVGTTSDTTKVNLIWSK